MATDYVFVITDTQRNETKRITPDEWDVMVNDGLALTPEPRYILDRITTLGES